MLFAISALSLRYYFRFAAAIILRRQRCHADDMLDIAYAVAAFALLFTLYAACRYFDASAMPSPR